MLHTIQQYYSWKGIKKDLANYLKSCDYCQKIKPFNSAPPITPIVAASRRDRCQFDLTEMETDSFDFRYILVIINTFTKFIWTKALVSKQSHEIVEW